MLLKTWFYTLLLNSSFTTAILNQSAGIEARNLFEVEHEVKKRSLFDVSDIAKADRKYLLDAQMEAVEIAEVALANMNKLKYAHFLEAWFGDRAHISDDITGVLTNFVGDNKNKEGASILNQVKVFKEDYWVENGQKFCDRTNKDGKTGVAYYMYRNALKVYGMHFCPKFFKRKGKEDYVSNKCASIAHHIDTATTSRQYRGANVLHEFMHFPKVGEAQTGAVVNDFVYGAYSSMVYQYKKVNGIAVNAALNADTYVYYAMHIWLSETCKRSFSFPRNTNDD